MKDFTFHALDKVLVRNFDYEVWRPDFFRDRMRGEDKEFICCLGNYSQCIPYDGDISGTNYSLEEVEAKRIPNIVEFGDRIRDIVNNREYRFIRSSGKEATCYDFITDSIVFVKHYEKVIVKDNKV